MRAREIAGLAPARVLVAAVGWEDRTMSGVGWGGGELSAPLRLCLNLETEAVADGASYSNSRAVLCCARLLQNQPASASPTR